MEDLDAKMILEQDDVDLTLILKKAEGMYHISSRNHIDSSLSRIPAAAVCCCFAGDDGDGSDGLRLLAHFLFTTNLTLFIAVYTLRVLV